VMNPYPYGFVRDSAACNADRDGLVSPQGELNDLRAVPGAFSRCQSAFGVRDLAGNLEEYAMESSTGQPVRKGGYWQPGANNCRLVHPHAEPSYHSIEVGFRCCSDALPGVSTSDPVPQN
jgi:sulfatase modifying factor 1